MKVDKHTVTSKVVTSHLELSNLDILVLVQDSLKEHGIEIKSSYTKSKVYVRVPGGGDYSNTDLTIDEDNPVRILIEYEEVEADK